MLLDANVLVYAINADAPQHAASRTVVQAALERRLPGVLVPQVLLEFFSVITGPRRLPRALPSTTAWGDVAALRAGLPVLDVQPAALNILGELVASHQPIGRAIFDCFLVAQMRSHGIVTICTYNVQDFARLRDVEALTPDGVLARHGLA